MTHLEEGLNDLVYRISRSVVTVEASNRYAAGAYQDAARAGLQSTVSSGIVIDSAGRILVSAGAVLGKDRITVTGAGRTSDARVVAIDYQSELALLQSTAVVGRSVRVSDRQTCAGQMVVAMGNAYGVRSTPWLGFCAGVRDDGMMQFSVPTASGTIGGGVFDMSGELLAVVVGGMGVDREVMVALPAYRIPEIARHLVTVGDRPSGFVGITSQEIEIIPGIPIPYPTKLATAGGRVAETINRGIVVTAVILGSPAHRAGLQTGDLVFAFDDVAVNSAPGLASLVQQSMPGKRVSVELLRQNQYLDLGLVIGSKQLRPVAAARSPWPSLDDARVDSLMHVIDFLKQEISRVEGLLIKLR
ncbi:MAG: serine protease [bacterium]|nr:serine protease [bacterium]